MNLEVDKHYLADALSGYMKRFPEIIVNDVNKKVDLPKPLSYDDVFICVKLNEVHVLNASAYDGGVVANNGMAMGQTHTYSKVKEGNASFGTWTDTPTMDKQAIKVAIELAERDAREYLGEYITESNQVVGFPLRNSTYEFEENLDAVIPTKYDIRSYDKSDLKVINDELISFAQLVKDEGKGQLRKVYADVISTLDLKLLGNSAGGLIFQKIPRTRVAVRCIAYPKRIIDSSNYFIGSKDYVLGAASGLELYHSFMDGEFFDLTDIAKHIASDSIDHFYNSISIDKTPWKPYKGVKIIFSPDTAGLLVHESLGHHVEQDLEDGQYGARFLRDSINDKVASKKLSIKFDPRHKVGKWRPYGSYFYDDECTLGKAAHIISKGYARDTLTDLSFASAYGVEPNGHSILDFIRMSNLVIDDSSGVSPDSLFEDARGKGFFIKTGHGGFTSEIMKQARVMIDSLYFIDKDGLKPIANLSKPKSSIRTKYAMNGFNLSVDSLDLLHKVKAVGKNVSSIGEPYSTPLPGSGHCGKEGEWSPTSHGGAYLQLEDILLTCNELDAPRKALFFKKKKVRSHD